MIDTPLARLCFKEGLKVHQVSNAFRCLCNLKQVIFGIGRSLVNTVDLHGPRSIIIYLYGSKLLITQKKRSTMFNIKYRSFGSPQSWYPSFDRKPQRQWRDGNSSLLAKLRASYFLISTCVVPPRESENLLPTSICLKNLRSFAQSSRNTQKKASSLRLNRTTIYV